MKFGLKFVDSCIVELIDMETAEILAEGPAAVQEWLTAYDGNYTLTLVQGCFFIGMSFAPRARMCAGRISIITQVSAFVKRNLIKK